MFKLSGLFKKTEEANTSKPSEVTKKVAPGTQLQYDPGLIKMLKQDHEELLEIWLAIGKAMDKQDVKTMASLLTEFKAKLNKHLLTENVKLYVYLTRSLTNDQQHSEVVKDFRSEMNHIGRTVTTFLRTYTQSPIEIGMLDTFKDEFEAIGGALVNRITREEDVLYALYLQE